jgi:peptide/nickel transport system ATP-binding protein
MATDRPSGPLLEVNDLQTWFLTRDGVTRAVDGVSFTIAAGETLAIVGESGCGKSVTALSLMRLLPSPPAQIVAGDIRFMGRGLLDLNEREMRDIRGNEIAMIFQEPMTSLNPVMTIGRQIAETLVAHKGLSRKAALERAVAILDRVRIPDARRRAAQYPHELSGGMRQRVMIAIALACDPKLLIADEPTTALDVTVQAQILDLMNELKRETSAAILLITHDLGVVAETAQRVIVMYAGRKIEEASVFDLFDNPLHPYTRALLASAPRSSAATGTGDRLAEIPGVVPSLRETIPGCAFAPRCSLVQARCHVERPRLEQTSANHAVACWATAEAPVRQEIA